jgi:hypothetical protein
MEERIEILDGRLEIDAKAPVGHAHQRVFAADPASDARVN